MRKFLIQLQEQTLHFLEGLHISHSISVILQSISMLIIILCVAWFFDSVAISIMRKYTPKVIGKTKNNWDNILLKNKVFSKIAHFIPGIVIILFYNLIASKSIRYIIELFIESYFIIVFLLLVNSIINSFNDIYDRLKGSNGTIKIYLQLVKVTIFSLGGIVIISIFANKNFIDILKGLGAMVTVLLIVYKDTIMGFVAGIQLSANKMMQIGDWISLPKDNADGTVIEVSLNTVKVQNWDRSITTIPTYKLMSESFTNWKGMQESGGRRIKRYITIDVDSIHFLSEEEIKRLGKFKLLEDYMAGKLKELEESNKGQLELVNQRRITNIGTFRKYIENYLLSTGFVNKDMTFMVRQLQASELGLPIEIYMFCTEKEWVNYERIQSDIFDHLFAVISEFNLSVFQRPSSDSLKNITGI